MHCMTRLANKNIAKLISISKTSDKISFQAFARLGVAPNFKEIFTWFSYLKFKNLTPSCPKRCAVLASHGVTAVSSVDTKRGPGNDKKIGRLNQQSGHQKQAVSLGVSGISIRHINISALISLLFSR